MLWADFRRIFVKFFQITKGLRFNSLLCLLAEFQLLAIIAVNPVRPYLAYVVLARPTVFFLE